MSWTGLDSKSHSLTHDWTGLDWTISWTGLDFKSLSLTHDWTGLDSTWTPVDSSGLCLHFWLKSSGVQWSPPESERKGWGTEKY